MTDKNNISNIDSYFELIAKELSGEISKEEKTNLLEWVNKSEENRVLYSQTVNAWKVSKQTINTPVFNTEQSWNNLKSKTVNSSSESNLFTKNSAFVKVAATLLLALGVAWIMKVTLWNKSELELVTYSSGEHKLELYLPDSSKVYMNKNSTLTYLTDFNTNERKVNLIGEAFFEVRKTEGKKFEVYGLRTITTVLGTSFSVRTITSDSIETIQVVTGKVAVVDLNKTEEEILLTPGYMARLNKSNGLSKEKMTDPNFISWKNNSLLFDNTPFTEVKGALENFFDIELIVNDPEILNCRFTGRFDEPKLSETLTIITTSTNSSFTKKGNVITLTGKGCKN